MFAEERLEVSAGQQFEHDEPGHGVEADADEAHDVLVVELAEKRNNTTGICSDIRYILVSRYF